MTKSGAGVLMAAALFVASCDRPALTPQTFVYTELVGVIHEALGRASLRSLGSKLSEISLDLPKGSSAEWSLSIGSGSCDRPGDVTFLAGPVEGGTLRRHIEASLDSLNGKIIVITRLGDSEVASCGAIAFSHSE